MLCHGKELQKQPELEKIVNEGQKHLQEAQTFVDVARKKLSIVSGMDKGTHDGEDWQKMLDESRTVHSPQFIWEIKSFRVRLSALIIRVQVLQGNLAGSCAFPKSSNEFAHPGR